MEEISVMICDDSALMRNLISRIIEKAPGLKVAGTAMNGRFLTEKIPLIKPDVIILDIEMPEMNGVEFLKWRKQNKVDIPVVILSSIAEKGAAVTMQCLELGAADFITKPNGSVSADINSVAERLVELVTSYGGQYARRNGRVSNNIQQFYSQQLEKHTLNFNDDNSVSAISKSIASFKVTAPVSAPQSITPLRQGGKIDVIAIGISTGGPNALREVFKNIDPKLKQPILVVQHMPAGFTQEFANSLNKICALDVKEAEDGDIIQGGHIYIAPGNYHIVVEKGGLNNKIRLSQEEQRNGHRPSADVLFESVAKVYQNNALGVIMTGMGRDGAVQLGVMRKQGAYTLGQDEESSIVYGMPKVAYELGGVQKQVPLKNMADEISKLAREHA